MNILIDIGHPCHIHLFRNFYTFMKDKHKVIVTIYQMKVLEDLCKAYKIDYVIKGKKYRSIIGKAYGILQHSLRLRMLIRKEKINMAIGVSATISLASLFSEAKSIILDDDDSNIQPLMAKCFHPLANTVLSPDVLKYENKKNAIYHSSYHELAYLHPLNFTPDDSVKRILQKDKKHYFILRFNAFVAHHDVGVSGLTLKQKKEIADLLANWGNVYISTEKEIDSELKKYKFPLSSDKMHSALYYADTYIGDSQTMATEAAVLGTMTFRCNSLANSLSLINEVSDKYGLVNNYLPQDFDQMLKDLKDFLNNSKRDIMKINRERLLKDKIDFSKFLIWFVENYPESAKIMKENPDYQLRFN